MRPTTRGRIAARTTTRTGRTPFRRFRRSRRHLSFVVFVTDGDPTARNISGSPGFQTGFTDGSYAVLNPAFEAANALKTSGIRVFAIGVGQALSSTDSQIRLRAISGDVQFPQHELRGLRLHAPDRLLAAPGGALADQLRALFGAGQRDQARRRRRQRRLCAAERVGLHREGDRLRQLERQLPMAAPRNRDRARRPGEHPHRHDRHHPRRRWNDGFRLASLAHEPHQHDRAHRRRNERLPLRGGQLHEERQAARPFPTRRRSRSAASTTTTASTAPSRTRRTPASSRSPRSSTARRRPCRC